MRHKKMWAGMSVLLIFAMLAGCSQAAAPAADTGSTSAETQTQAPADNAATEAGDAATEAAPAGEAALPLQELSFPIVEEPITVSWFAELDAKTSATKKSYGEVEAYQVLAELTNIQVEWMHPPTGQAAEQFNLMMASGDLADIVQFGRGSYPGGPTKAISDNLILPLNDLIADYAPNLSRLYETYPDVARMARTDEGVYFSFPSHSSYEMYQRAPELQPAFYTFGWQIRQDWLDSVGMEVPETMDEWYEVLTAFKTQDPNGNGEADEIPLVHKGIDINQWCRAWGLNYDFHQVDGVVKFGPYEPEYREFLETMNRWYTEGLLDLDYVTTDGNQFDAKVTSNQAGAWTGATSGTLGRLVQLMTAADPSVKLTGTVQPYVTGGEPYNFDWASFYPTDGSGAVISAKSEYANEIAQMLDYGYSDEGDALLNWGIEGKSYTNDNGNFTLTEEIVANPDGLSLDQALAQYAPGANGGTFFNSNSLWNQRMWMPEQQEAVSRWSVGSGERILAGISPTTEESSRSAEIMSRVNTYRDEMLNKFIMGINPISEFDDYIQNIKDMGIEDAIAIQQAALDRYEAR